MSLKTAWENILKAAKMYRGNGDEWEALFESIRTLAPLVEAAQKAMDGNEEAKDGL